MTDESGVLGQGWRALGFLVLGGLSTGATAWTSMTLEVPVGRWLYGVVYPLVGPDGAVRVGTIGRYTLVMLATVAVPVLLAMWLMDRPVRETPVGTAVLAQLAIVGVVPVAILLSTLMVFVLGLLTAGLVVVLGVVWYRGDADADALATLIGGGAVLTLVVLIGIIVPLGWNPHVIVATELSADTPTATQESDVVSAALTAPATRCDGNESTPRTCYLVPSDPLIRYLDRQGVRCPFEEGTSASVRVTHNGTAYRVTCKTYED